VSHRLSNSSPVPLRKPGLFFSIKREPRCSPPGARWRLIRSRAASLRVAIEQLGIPGSISATFATDLGEYRSSGAIKDGELTRALRPL